MKRNGLVFGVLYLLLAMAIAPAMGTNHCQSNSAVEKEGIARLSNNGNTLYVGGSGPNNYTKIQDAIDNASDGDTIFVYDDSSPYQENVVVDKPIVLLGEDRNTTVVDGGGTGTVIVVVADSLTVAEFTIQNGGSNWSDSGIELLNTDDCLISDNNIFKTHKGILLDYSNNNYIVGNKFLNNKAGITVIGGNNNVINDNIFKCNVEGIDMNGSNNMIRNNTLTNHSIGIDVSNFRNKIIDNTIENNIDKGIYVWGSYFHTIIGNTISNSYYGIYLVGNSLKGGSDWNRIGGNTLQNNNYGIMLTGSSDNNFIHNNNFINNDENAFFKDCWHNFWFRNYWNEPRLLPKVIEGKVKGQPWINIDWFPRMMPYEAIEDVY